MSNLHRSTPIPPSACSCRRLTAVMFSMALPLALTLRLSLPLPPPSCPLPRRRSQAPPPHPRDLVLGHLLQLRLCFVVRALTVPRRVRVGPAHDSHDVTPRPLRAQQCQRLHVPLRCGAGANRGVRRRLRGTLIRMLQYARGLGWATWVDASKRYEPFSSSLQSSSSIRNFY